MATAKKNAVEPSVSKTEFNKRAKKNQGFSVVEVAGMLGYTSARIYQFLNGLKKDGEVVAKPVIKESWGLAREERESYKVGTVISANAVEKLAKKTGRDLSFA